MVLRILRVCSLGFVCNTPGIPTTIKTMGVNITTIVYLRVLIIQIGSTIILMVVEAQGYVIWNESISQPCEKGTSHHPLQKCPETKNGSRY